MPSIRYDRTNDCVKVVADDGGVIGRFEPRLIARQSADLVSDLDVVLSDLPGLTHDIEVGTYAFRIALQTLATANGGLAVAFILTTAVLGEIDAIVRAYSAAAVACSRVTTATSGTEFYGANDAVTQLVVEGTFTVTTAGSIKLQACQDDSHADQTDVYEGSTFEIVKIAD